MPFARVARRCFFLGKLIVVVAALDSVELAVAAFEGNLVHLLVGRYGSCCYCVC